MYSHKQPTKHLTIETRGDKISLPATQKMNILLALGEFNYGVEHIQAFRLTNVVHA
jgi:hypothetical protein